MLSGEHLQIRVCPRGVANKPIASGETRVIAVRRTRRGLSSPQVAFAVLFLPESCVSVDCHAPMSSARTIGCRGVQLLLPSLFAKHDPHRDRAKGHADIDVCGFHTVRPHTVAITKRLPANDGPCRLSLSVAPGESYLVIAGHICGVDVPDPLCRAAITVTDLEHKKRVGSLTRTITRSVGESEAALYVSSALTIVDLLGAEGIIGMLCHSLFQGVLPDMLHSPIGMVLCLVMASRIACHPGRFNLPACTKQDEYANKEMTALFEARWEPVMKNGYRAIDVAIQSGRDNASARSVAEGVRTPLLLLLAACLPACPEPRTLLLPFVLPRWDGCLCARREQVAKDEDGFFPFMDDNLAFWQRVGQRINSKVMSDPQDDRRSDKAAERRETRFGHADLLFDPVTDAKYAALARNSLATPVREAPIRHVCFAPRGDMRTTFQRMSDAVERWLRTGMYGSTQLSRPNPVITPKTGPNGAWAEEDGDEEASSSSSGEDDGEDVLHKLCNDAVESSGCAISIALIHGAFIVHQARSSPVRTRTRLQPRTRSAAVRVCRPRGLRSLASTPLWSALLVRTSARTATRAWAYSKACCSSRGWASALAATAGAATPAQSAPRTRSNLPHSAGAARRARSRCARR